MYCDEVGHNAVGRDNRKVECIYWAFLEFGQRLLHNENVWFTVATVRSALVKHLSGKMSHLFKLLLNGLFFNAASGSDLRTGVMLPLDDTDIQPLLFGKFGCIVADEKALTEVLCNKGQAGSDVALHTFQSVTTRRVQRNKLAPTSQRA